MKKTRILFVAQEMQPYLEITEIANLARNLPPAMQDKGVEIRVLMPKFGCINERKHRLHEVVRLSGINIIINDNDNPLVIKVASLPSAKIQVYFLDNDEYFYRKYAFRGPKDEFFPDNHERTIFFSRGVIETVLKLGWAPDLVVCQGWMSCLIPAYLKKVYHGNPVFKDSKILYSLHGNHFTETFPADFVPKAVGEYINEADLTAYHLGSHLQLDLAAGSFADGFIIHPETHPELVAYAQNSDKPYILASEDANVEAFPDFFRQIIEPQTVLL